MLMKKQICKDRPLALLRCNKIKYLYLVSGFCLWYSSFWVDTDRVLVNNERVFSFSSLGGQGAGSLPFAQISKHRTGEEVWGKGDCKGIARRALHGR